MRLKKRCAEHLPERLVYSRSPINVPPFFPTQPRRNAPEDRCSGSDTEDPGPCPCASHFLHYSLLFKKPSNGDFPGGAVVKNPLTNAGDTGLSPGPGRSHTPRSN